MEEEKEIGLQDEPDEDGDFDTATQDRLMRQIRGRRQAVRDSVDRFAPEFRAVSREEYGSSDQVLAIALISRNRMAFGYMPRYEIAKILLFSSGDVSSKGFITLNKLAVILAARRGVHMEVYEIAKQLRALKRELRTLGFDIKVGEIGDMPAWKLVLKKKKTREPLKNRFS